jgi:hypothetical protein
MQLLKISVAWIAFVATVAAVTVALSLGGAP